MTTETLDARRFRALQQDWLSEDLARFFLLAQEDMREVRTCRGAANRLGFSLHLLLLRLLYCPLPELNLAPARIIQFVAMQLNVHPEALAEYSTRRPQTRDEHLVQIRTYLKLRPYFHEEDATRATNSPDWVGWSSPARSVIRSTCSKLCSNKKVASCPPKS